MTWLLLATAAQFLNAVVAIIDKYIVTDERVLPRPFVYAFYTSLLAGVWVVVYAFSIIPIPAIEWLGVPSYQNIERPTLEVVALAFLASYSFFIGLVSLFTALRSADASDVVPVVGAVSAIGSFGLSYFFLDPTTSPNFIWGIVLLATGTFLVSRLRFSTRIALTSLHAGLFFAFHFVTLKGLFDITSFDNGFFWSRISFMLLALTMLILPTYYRKIREQTESTSRGAGALILFNKLLAGIATVMILKATALGDVAVVQALGGLQFVFILLIGILIGHRAPATCGEQSCRRRDAVQKALFVSIITLGFIMLFV